MKIFLTGGSGFLGSHVADALSDAGHDVVIFDAVESPYLRDDQTMVVGDLLDTETVEKAMEGAQAVYHFAGVADIEDCAEDPLRTVNVNVLGTVQLLESCIKSGVDRFIFASSAYVFSESGAFYRTSKRACESFIEDYATCYGLKYTCLRYGSLYGPRANGKNSIHSLLKQAVQNGEIVYHGSGEEQREFIHVFDAARSSVDVLAPEFENQNVILTGVEKLRYLDLLEMIQEIFGGKVTLTVKPSKRKAHYKMTPYSFAPKLGRKLVSNPYVDFGQGLLDCISELHSEQISNGGRLLMDAVFFDFDGVVLDSVHVKTEAFGDLYAEHGDAIRRAVIDYHVANGGVSRFDKFRYYHEELLGITMTDELMDDLCARFNELSLSRVMEAAFIPGAEATLRSLKAAGIPAFVASGTPQKELEATVAGRGLDPYFVELHGSPRKKGDIVADVLERYGYAPSRCVFIGDALADRDAAVRHHMPFVGVVTNGESIFPAGTITINVLSHDALTRAVNG